MLVCLQFAILLAHENSCAHSMSCSCLQVIAATNTQQAVDTLHIASQMSRMMCRPFIIYLLGCIVIFTSASMPVDWVLNFETNCAACASGVHKYMSSTVHEISTTCFSIFTCPLSIRASVHSDSQTKTMRCIAMDGEQAGHIRRHLDSDIASKRHHVTRRGSRH